MKIGKKLAKVLAVLSLCLAIGVLATGCSGSDSEKAVQKTVDDLTGKSTVEAGNMMKKQINVLTDQQVEKARKDLEHTPGEEPDGQEQGK